MGAVGRDAIVASELPVHELDELLVALACSEMQTVISRACRAGECERVRLSLDVRHDLEALRTLRQCAFMSGLR